MFKHRPNPLIPPGYVQIIGKIVDGRVVFHEHLLDPEPPEPDDDGHPQP